MATTTKDFGVLKTPNQQRIIDANLNRLREGLRVLEDICRFGYDDEKNASLLKSLRHDVRIDDIKSLLNARDIQNDILKTTTKSELSRQDLSHIITANIKRAQESTRVLEEILKLFDAQKSATFKHIRYTLYDIEKNLCVYL